MQSYHAFSVMVTYLIDIASFFFYFSKLKSADQSVWIQNQEKAQIDKLKTRYANFIMSIAVRTHKLEKTS